MLLRDTTLLLVGATLGAGLVIGTVVLVNSSGLNQLDSAEQVVSPTPSQSIPRPTPTLVPQVSPRIRQLEELKRRLFEQGVTIRAEVKAIYPGTGLIIRDRSGTEMFVRWDKPELNFAEGQVLSIQGTLGRVDEAFKAQIDSETNHNLELLTFLDKHPTFIKARILQE